MGRSGWFAIAALVIGGLLPLQAQAHPEILVFGDAVDEGVLPGDNDLTDVTGDHIFVYEEDDNESIPAWTENKPTTGISMVFQGAAGATCTSPGFADGGSFLLHFSPTNPSVARALVVVADPLAGVAHGQSCLEQFESDASLPDIFPDEETRGLEVDDQVYFDSTSHAVAVKLNVSDPDLLDEVRVFADLATANTRELDYACDPGVAIGSNTVSFRTILNVPPDSEVGIATYNVAVDLPGATACSLSDNPCDEAFGFFFCRRVAVVDLGAQDETSLRCDIAGPTAGTAIAMANGSLLDLSGAACNLAGPSLPTVDGGLPSTDAAVPGDAGVNRPDASAGRDASGPDARTPTVDAGNVGSRADGVRFVGGGGCSTSPEGSGFPWLAGVALLCWRRSRR